MSDSRNSSNSVRGGGAKQTGGAGRTNKHATGNQKTDLLGQQGLQAHNDRSEGKRKLQLQLTSKQLAADVRATLLSYHTEKEYEEYQIPLPSTDDAKKKLKAMKEFTEKWHDKEFREEWLQTVTDVWLEELKSKYEAAVEAAKAAKNPPQEQKEGVAMSIEELQEMIQNLDTNVSPEERQRLKKKLKKKKQRQQKEKEKAKKMNNTPVV